MNARALRRWPLITRLCTFFLGNAGWTVSAEDDVWAKGTADQFNIEFVTVGDPGNPPKTGTKYLFDPGAVPYAFRSAKDAYSRGVKGDPY